MADRDSVTSVKKALQSSMMLHYGRQWFMMVQNKFMLNDLSCRLTRVMLVAILTWWSFCTWTHDLELQFVLTLLNIPTRIYPIAKLVEDKNHLIICYPNDNVNPYGCELCQGWPTYHQGWIKHTWQESTILAKRCQPVSTMISPHLLSTDIDRVINHNQSTNDWLMTLVNHNH